MRLSTAIALAVLCGLSGAFARQSTSASVEDAAIDRAAKIIKEHHLLPAKQQQRCMSLMYRDDSDAKTAKVGVYEVHDKECGGDPDFSHRLFDLEIDMKTGAAKWDYNSDAAMQPVPKRAH